MTKPVTGLNVFAAQTGPIPLSQLDADVSALQAAINDTATYSNYYLDTSGAPNQLTVTTTAGVTFAYGAGVMLQVKIANTNTAAAVNINVNALGNVAVKRADGSALAVGELVAGEVVSVVYDGANFLLQSATVYSAVNIQVFTAGGTWTKPTNAKFVQIMIMGPGGGGGSGSRRAAATPAVGGSGGGGGAYVSAIFPASLLGATEAVTVPVGGAGGAAQTVDNSAGNSGANGAIASFGSWLRAAGGGGGDALGTSAPGGITYLSTGTRGGNSGAGGGGGTSGVPAPTGTNNAAASAAGGPSGGGVSGADAASNGSAGYLGDAGTVAIMPTTTVVIGSFGIAPGGNGGPSSGLSANQWFLGFAGGSGASHNAGVGGNGGAGAGYGYGGAGGGASRNGNNSGAGAAGGPGLCVVISTS